MKISRSELYAIFLCHHPECVLSDYLRGKERLFWYDSTNGKFMSQIPSNVVRNQPSEARGLRDAYNSFFRKRYQTRLFD